MAGGRPPTFISFKCPNCEALYQLVKVEAGPETTFHDVACPACGVPLPGREGNLILKYFLLRNGGRRRRAKRSGS
jgi:ribosomal protein S27E